MRRMFSEKQLHQIVAEVLNKDENIEWVKSISEYFSYDADEDVYTFNSNVVFNEAVFLGDWDLFVNVNNKLENPTDLSTDTFGANPIARQLPDADKDNLTEQEVLSIKENMLYWIQKGYFIYGESCYKIVHYSITPNGLDIHAGYTMFADDGTLMGIDMFYIGLSLETSSYSYLLSQV